MNQNKAEVMEFCGWRGVLDWDLWNLASAPGLSPDSQTNTFGKMEITNYTGFDIYREKKPNSEGLLLKIK